MSLEQIVLLALIQGITEFLPISSSGHLSLIDELTGMADQGILMDIAVHAGTLGAVLLYFRHDVLAMTVGGLQIFTGRLTDSPVCLVSDALREACTGAEIDREPRTWERPSDHAPAMVTLG